MSRSDRLFRVAVLALSLLVGTANVNATTIDFNEVLVLRGQGRLIHDGYGDLNWSGWSSWFTYNGVTGFPDWDAGGALPGGPSGVSGGLANITKGFGSAIGGTSCPSANCNSTNTTAVVFGVASGTFTLVDAIIGGLWHADLVIEVNGYNGGGLIYSTTFLTAPGPHEESFNWTNLTSVSIASRGGYNSGYSGDGQQFVMDNLNILLEDPQEAPLPGELALFLCALGMMMRFHMPRARYGGRLS